MLSTAAYARARAYIEHEARPLDKALFAHAADGGSTDDVIRALAAYRRDDGGFGNALEPDVRLPASTVIDTITGLGILYEIGATQDEPLLRGAIGYLVDVYDPEIGGWRMVPPAINTVPHASHWNYELQAELAWPIHANPGALILMYLLTYPDDVPSQLIAELTEKLPERIAGVIDGLGEDSLGAVVKLLESPRCPAELREALRARVLLRGAAMVENDVSKWGGYVPMPLKLAPRPDAFLAEAVRDGVPANLDWLIERQSDEGSWSPNWDWRGNYPQAWEQAKHEWTGVITRETLGKLAAWGRIET